ADFLSHYANQYAVANGVSIYALSMANEPDTSGVSWDTCAWTSDQFANFLASYLSPTFSMNSITAKVIAPESANWDYVETTAPTFPAGSPPFLTSTYNNPTALSRLDIAAGHIYYGTPSRPFQTALNDG